MQTKQAKRIRKVDFIKVYFRSFFLQSAWNYRSLLSVGFEICLIPILKRLYPGIQPRRESLLRHLKFFNAHPYLASYALGVSMRLEEGIAAGSSEKREQLDKVKDLLITTLGAKGDELFWQTIRPFSLVMGVLGLFVFESNVFKIMVLILTFFMYNIPHLYIRYIGLVEGYEFGLDVYKCLTSDCFNTLGKFYFYFGTTAFLLLILLLIWRFFQDDPVKVFFLVGSVFYLGILYKISNNFYSSTFFTIVFFLVVSFLFF